MHYYCCFFRPSTFELTPGAFFSLRFWGARRDGMYPGNSLLLRGNMLLLVLLLKLLTSSRFHESVLVGSTEARHGQRRVWMCEKESSPPGAFSPRG